MDEERLKILENRLKDLQWTKSYHATRVKECTIEMELIQEGITKCKNK